MNWRRPFLRRFSQAGAEAIKTVWLKRVESGPDNRRRAKKIYKVTFGQNGEHFFFFFFLKMWCVGSKPERASAQQCT